MILDFATGTVRAVSDLHGLFQSTGSRDSREHEAHVWSDDGKQLAVWFVKDGTTPTIAIVDTRTLSVDYIQSDAQFFQRLAWSHNSQWLAVTAGRCDSDPCTSRLQIVDAQANRVVQQFAAPHATVGYAGDMLCDLVWSPDDRYVAMRTICSDKSIYSKREVFLANITTGELVQLTNYNQQYEDRIISPYYRTFWLGDEMLIGVLIYGETILRLETLKYSPASKSLTTIDDARLEQIVRNPMTSTLFVQRLTRDTDNVDNPLKFSAEVRDDQNSRVVARFANLSGHDFSWSPDGEYFASTIRCTGTCTVDIEQIMIATASGEIVTSVTLENPKNDPATFYVPLGWVSQ
jgi:Tol biopolymer transport system component